MLVNLTIASADVCRVNKRWNNFLYLILIALLYKKILHFFGKNCFAHSTNLCTLLVWFNVDVPSPSKFLLALFELIVKFLQHSICASYLLSAKHGGIDFFCCSYASSPLSWGLAFLFLFEV